jgi:hypothetical protein
MFKRCGYLPALQALAAVSLKLCRSKRAFAAFILSERFVKHIEVYQEDLVVFRPSSQS